jgi:hypothetical protein
VNFICAPARGLAGVQLPTMKSWFGNNEARSSSRDEQCAVPAADTGAAVTVNPAVTTAATSADRINQLRFFMTPPSSSQNASTAQLSLRREI